MPFIIWGSKGVTSTKTSGDFHCPRCGKAAYDHKEVKRFFTLYWIPLFPINTLGEYIECGTCAETFDTAVLDYDPGKQQAKFLSKFDAAARRLMALMVLADGEIDDEEIATMVEISASLPGDGITEAEARAEVDRAANQSEDLVGYLIDVREELNDKGKLMLLKVALQVAMADGDFADEEKLLLMKIGEALTLDSDLVLQVIGAMAEA